MAPTPGTGAYRPTVAEVDLRAVAHNCRVLRDRTAPGTLQLAVVKANGYGHGVLPVAEACLQAGVQWLGVALVEEGVELRESGVTAPILVLVQPTPGSERALVDASLVASVSTVQAAEELHRAAAGAGVVQPVHMVVDTGMHREGVHPDEAVRLARAIAGMPACELQGVWTHFAVADEPAHPATGLQVQRFDAVLQRLRDEGIDPGIVHAANTAATITRPDAHYDMVRTGIGIYGLWPSPELAGSCDLRPAMRLVSRVGLVREVAAGDGVSYGLTYAPAQDAVIASVPVGYGDGYPRLLSCQADVLIGGRRRKVAGRVTMDQILVDCAADSVAVGDEVVLLGRQDGEEVSAEEIARHIGTINYEVVTAIGPRVPRIYV